jgi:hypoxanthine phosphoribosyltransferase
MRKSDNDYNLLFDYPHIRNKVDFLAGEISNHYKNAAQIPILIGVLKGGFIFLADLVRMMTIDCEIDFIQVSSYSNGRESSGKIKIERDISAGIRDRDILIVDDIVDTGLTMKFLIEYLYNYKPSTIRYAALLCRKSCIIKPDFIGFDLMEPEFVVGYGLDDKQKMRGLINVCTINPEKTSRALR